MTVLLRRLLFVMLAALAALPAWAQTPAVQGGAAPATADAAAQSRDLVLATEIEQQDVPRGYALVVGVGAYPKLDAARQLQYSESDAEAMYRVLISKEGGAFPAENVKLLTGSEATLANIKRELEEWLPSVAQPSDRVVVYFAGHGFVQDGKGYFAPSDVDPEQLEDTAYPMSAVGDVLANKIKANWKVLLTDACHSGKINVETTNEALQRQFDALPTTFLTLTAATETEQSFESRDLGSGYGFFTYFLVQAFTGYADSDPCDGRITADELVAYVRSSVRRYARERSLSQTPTARGDYEPHMLLGVANGCLDALDQKPSMLGTAIVESNLDVVQVYIDGWLVGTASKGRALVVPGLPSGQHDFEGVKAGYEPDRKQILIAPGQDSTVTLRIRYARQLKKSAVDLNDAGEKLLFTRRSSLSLANAFGASRQGDDDLKKAQGLFERALTEDPNYVTAAYNLGQAHQLLLEYDEALANFRRAIAIDSTHIDSHTQAAAVLIERGDPDDGIRELLEVLRLDPADDNAYAMLSRAYWDKGAWLQSIEQADRALKINPDNAQANLWRADSLRQLAAAEKDAARQRQRYADAREGYRTFLAATNFESSVVSKIAFHLIGFGIGTKRHADRQGAYDSLRSAGFLGLCLSEEKVGNPLRARDYCRRAIKHAPDDPIAYFLLGNINRDIYNVRTSCEYLVAARASYRRMLELNPDLDESRNAKNYLQQIANIAPQLGCRA
jgi:tetratricopeptide (TPR) repeat protein